MKVERITALSNNLALALAAHSIRIEAPVPGKPLVGIEVPNTATSLVSLRSVIESQAFQKVKAKSNLPLALGKGTAGEAVAADLSKMPHLLIAGETGSGKTVCINSIITCLLMLNEPQNLRLLLMYIVPYAPIAPDDPIGLLAWNSHLTFFSLGPGYGLR